MNRFLTTLALAAGIACAAFGYEPPRHNDTFTTNGVTYAQRGGLGAADYVVTNADFSTGNAKLVETIQTTSPSPGDYANVSNKAVNALSRAEAKAGFTEWGYDPPTINGKVCSVIFDEEIPGWVLYLDDEPTSDVLHFAEDETELVFDDNYSVTATRTRLPTMADVEAKASTNDVQLTPIYSNTPTFSEWVCQPNIVTVYWDDFRNMWQTSPAESTNVSGEMYNQNATNIVFRPESDGGEVTATRTRTDIIGYTLGDQSDKPLQPKGDYAPATNIAKSALAQNVQASLDKADTALQTAPVTSVNGRTRDVVLNAQDVGARAKDDFSAENRWVLTYEGNTTILRPSGVGWTGGTYDLSAVPVSSEEGAWTVWSLYDWNNHLGDVETDISESDTIQELIIAGRTLRRGLRLVDDYDLAYGVTNIQKSALSSEVQTSLGKADNALGKTGNQTLNGTLTVNTGNGSIRTPVVMIAENTAGASLANDWIITQAADGNLEFQVPMGDGNYKFFWIDGSKGDSALAFTSDLSTLEQTIPNNITRTATDATLVHCNDGTCTNAILYIRQATHSLAGLITAADKTALDALVATAVTRQTVTNVVDEVKELHYDDELGVTWETRIVGGEMKFFAVTNTNISVLGN